jgi:hypothetical protein
MILTKIVAGSCWNRIKDVGAMCGQNALCLLMFTFPIANVFVSRFQRPRCLKKGFATAPLLILWFRIPPGKWMSVFCVLCVVRCRSLRRAYRSSGGYLRTVIFRCVWSINLNNEDAMSPHWAHGTTGKNTLLWKTQLKVPIFQQIICRFLKLLLTMLFQTWFLYANNGYTSNSKK